MPHFAVLGGGPCRTSPECLVTQRPSSGPPTPLSHRPAQCVRRAASPSPARLLTVVWTLRAERHNCPRMGRYRAKMMEEVRVRGVPSALWGGASYCGGRGQLSKAIAKLKFQKGAPEDLCQVWVPGCDWGRRGFCCFRFARELPREALEDWAPYASPGPPPILPGELGSAALRGPRLLWSAAGLQDSGSEGRSQCCDPGLGSWHPRHPPIECSR